MVNLCMHYLYFSDEDPLEKRSISVHLVVKFERKLNPFFPRVQAHQARRQVLVITAKSVFVHPAQ